MDVARTGSTVHVVAGVNGSLAKIVAIESPDEGKSWGQPVELASEMGAIGSVHVASTASGLVVAWHAAFIDERGIWARVRPPGATRWSDRRSVWTCGRPPALTVSADGTVRAVLTPDDEEPGGKLEYVECDPASGRRLLKAPGPPGFLPGTLLVDPVLLEAGPVAVWLAIAKPPGQPRRLLWSRSARPELGRWSPLEDVDESQRGASHLDAAVLGRSFALVCESRDGLELYRHPGGKAGFELPPLTPEPPVGCMNPTIAARESGFLLAFTRFTTGTGKVLNVYSSSDGAAWKAGGKQDTPVLTSRHSRSVAMPGALLVVTCSQEDGVRAVRVEM